jgi:hypothetical protein
LDLYGLTRSSWTWCWKCRQAIALDELATSAAYHVENGWSHASCPPAGTAPTMPPGRRLARDWAAAEHYPTPRAWWDA